MARSGGTRSDGRRVARVKEWAPGGRLWPRITQTADQLNTAGLPVNLMIWHQGESDAIDATDPEKYRADPARLVAALPGRVGGRVDPWPRQRYARQRLPDRRLPPQRQEADSIRRNVGPSGQRAADHTGRCALALLWQILQSRLGDAFVTVRASPGRRSCEEVEDGLPDGGHARLRWWPCDSCFSVPLL